nr:MAG TPA: hypothetical protein [Bacteriophage sp.]DAV23898.1 MAG TPA: hypothetical protein [Bacteriophage sp.]
MVTGLEPCDSPKCSLERPHILNVCIITTIRLSRLS